MRKMVTLFLTLLLAFPVPPALAAPSTTVIFTIGSTTYTVNGQDRSMDVVAPYIDAKGRTPVPIR